MIDATERIKKFLEDLTGLQVREKITDDEFVVTIGHIDPVRVGFWIKKHPERSMADIRYSTYVKTLHLISNMLRAPKTFNEWIAEEIVRQS